MNVVYATAVDLSAGTGARDHVINVVDELGKLGSNIRLIGGVGHSGSEAGFSSRLARLGSHIVRTDGATAFGAAREVSRVALKVIRQERPDAVYLRTFPADYLLLARRLDPTIPLFVELNTITRAEYRASGKPLRALLYSAMERPSLRRADGWLPVTNEIAAWAERSSGVQRPTLIAGNGFPPQATAQRNSRAWVRERLGVPDNLPVLVMAGASAPAHGVDRALELHAQLPFAAELWLVGAKPSSSATGVSPDRGASSSIRRFPWLPQEEALDLMAAADLGLGPMAIDRRNMTESQPLKVGTYLALGLPTLINYRDPRLEGASTRFVRQLSPEASSSELAAAAAGLLRQPKHAGEEARHFAINNFSWSSIAEKTLKFMENVIFCTA